MLNLNLFFHTHYTDDILIKHTNNRMEPQILDLICRFFTPKMLISTFGFATMKQLFGKWGTSEQQKNTIREVNGLVHAFIASFLSINAFLSEPKLELDLMYSTNVWAENCVNISTGYFLADTLIIIFRRQKNEENTFNANILFHHLAAFGALYYALCSNFFMRYSTMWLLLEVSSILLKARKIWKINNFPGIGDIRNHILVVLNLTLFIVFRLFVIIFAISWWSKNINRISLFYTVLPFSGSIVVGVINIRYFHLLLKSDIMPMIRSYAK